MIVNLKHKSTNKVHEQAFKGTPHFLDSSFSRVNFDHDDGVKFYRRSHYTTSSEFWTHSSIHQKESVASSDDDSMVDQELEEESYQIQKTSSVPMVKPGNTISMSTSESSVPSTFDTEVLSAQDNASYLTQEPDRNAATVV